MPRWLGCVVLLLGCLAVAVPALSAGGARMSGSDRTPAINTKNEEKGGKKSKGEDAEKSPTTKPATKPSKSAPALLIDKVYAMVLDTKPAKKVLPRIDEAFEETRLKVAALERGQRRNRSWMKARIEQEIDAVVMHVEDMLTDAQREQLRKAYREHKDNIPSAQRRRARSGAAK